MVSCYAPCLRKRSIGQSMGITGNCSIQGRKVKSNCPAFWIASFAVLKPSHSFCTRFWFLRCSWIKDWQRNSHLQHAQNHAQSFHETSVHLPVVAWTARSSPDNWVIWIEVMQTTSERRRRTVVLGRGRFNFAYGRVALRSQNKLYIRVIL